MPPDGDQVIGDRGPADTAIDSSSAAIAAAAHAESVLQSRDSGLATSAPGTPTFEPALALVRDALSSPVAGPGEHRMFDAHLDEMTGHPFRAGLPSFVRVVDCEGFHEEIKPGLVLHAVPCLSKAGAGDPVEKIPLRAPGDESVRVGLVHGTTFDLANCEMNFPIRSGGARARGLDYLAIGDTHGYRVVQEDPPVVYPGAPEPTAFDEVDPGHVVLVLVDESTIAEAQKAEESAKNRHDALLGELCKSEGALHASGGAVADEKLRDLEAALQRAHEKQANLQDEYEAWKLLAETLKDAERSQATHLGNVLAPELAARLQALAGQRYSRIALSPHLRLEGIDAAGGQRELERLSIGTREQISTLFRLCLAERLQSALLLDDQLVQSDPDRLRWFRRALRQTAAMGVQVVVLTCRPDDYLELAETPPPHVVDLGTVVTG